MRMLNVVIKCLVVILPWKLKHVVLNRFYHYNIHPKARIGLSYIFPKYLVMEEGARIGHFNVAIHLDRMLMGRNSTMSRSNWITGFPTNSGSRHFSYDLNRKSELVMGKESAITKNHHIDCTNRISIGDFVTIAGYGSQLLTHSINIYTCRQESRPISIGNYCFVSTNVKILGGSSLPDYSVLGAGAVLNKAYSNEYTLYAGVPAKPVKEIVSSAKYFNREKGFVY